MTIDKFAMAMQQERGYIGFGGSGFAILENFEILQIEGEKICFSLKNESTDCISVYANIIELQKQLKPQVFYTVVGGLGGTCGTEISTGLKFLKTNGYNYEVKIFMPFNFEGTRRTRIAQEQLNLINIITKPTVFYLSDYKKDYGHLLVGDFWLVCAKLII